MFYDMLLLKMLKVSERTRMSVVLHSSEFAVRKLVVEQRTSSLFRSFAGSAYFAVTLRTKPVKNVQNSKYSSINLVPHNYTLQIVHYPLFLALYRRSRQTVWFDSG